MEAGGAGGRRPPVGRMEASPERGRPTTYALSARPAPARPMRKVQIIYYLCRNGQLEHPHFMELAQHPHQPLRLKGKQKHFYGVGASKLHVVSSIVSAIKLLMPLQMFLFSPADVV